MQFELVHLFHELVPALAASASALQISRRDEDGFHIVDADDVTMATEQQNLEENTPNDSVNFVDGGF